MTTYYKATFSDGTTIRRSTEGRTYSHAWLVRGRGVSIPDYTWTRSGFSSTDRLARQAMGTEKTIRATFAEIAPAIEITRKEYLELA